MKKSDAVSQDTFSKTSRTFLEEVVAGLSGRPKRLSSSHLYDEEGSRIFEEIMRVPEYYPTRCETEILANGRQDILELMGTDGGPFHLVDLGAGNGAKTRILLEHFHRQGALRAYVPVDISGSAVKASASGMEKSLPGLPVQPFVGDYMDALRHWGRGASGRKLVLFLGSTIGNFDRRDAAGFLQGLRSCLRPGDGLLIGFDLRKEPQRILRAYADEAGVTSRFNLNLLARINRELGGEFPLGQFLHHAVYDPAEGVARSYLVSRQDQTIRIRKAERTFLFQAWETIHTENAFKYVPGESADLATESGFQESAIFWDSGGYFQDSFWRPIGQ